MLTLARVFFFECAMRTAHRGRTWRQCDRCVFAMCLMERCTQNAGRHVDRFQTVIPFVVLCPMQFVVMLIWRLDMFYRFLHIISLRGLQTFRF